MRKYRKYFPVTENKIYFNHAATAPLSTRVNKKLKNHLHLRSTDPEKAWKEMFQTGKKLKSLICNLINAESPDRIAYTQNTTHGLNIIASGLEWEDGDEILIPEKEFPANVYPYKNLERKGVDIKFLPVPQGGLSPETLRKNITSRTKLLSISFVEFLSGYKHDMEELGKICKENNIIFIVDSIQGVGAIPIDVQKFHIDGLANGGHKWLMAPAGTGFLYITKQLQEQIKQKHLGWSGLKDMKNFLDYNKEVQDSARRYELGTLNFGGLIGARASISLLLEVGINNIYNQIKTLTTLAIKKLKEHNFNIYTNQNLKNRSGIVTFYPDQNSEELYHHLTSDDVVCSYRDGMIRISPHFYNTVDEIKKLVELCQAY